MDRQADRALCLCPENYGITYSMDRAAFPDCCVFLFGFFRRDFGAAGLYGMHDAGLLTGVQLVVAAITLTLFMPCIAQFMMTVKERGFKMALAISGFIFPSALLAGFIVNTLMTALRVKL